MTYALSNARAPGKEMNKMGCIYRRKNSKFYWIKYYRNGKPYQESTHSDKVEIAKRFLRLREGEISQGKIPGIYFERVTFNELTDDFLTDYRINGKRSIKKAERSVKKLKDVFGGMKATGITTAAVKRYIEKRMEEDASNASVNRELSALKRSFNLAIRCTPPKVSHVPYIPMLKENNIRKGFFDPEDFVSLIKALPDYLKPVVRFAYATGWRRGEILSLTWRQVDLNNGTVRLEPGETKNNEGRTIYLERDLWDMMKDLFDQRKLGCPYVFNLEGAPLSDFRKSWGKACQEAGIPYMLFHDFRRTAVRNMVRAGIPERVAMAISGHKTRSVFDRYNIVSPEDLKEAAVKRQLFDMEQNERLHSGYSTTLKEKRVVTLKAATL